MIYVAKNGSRLSNDDAALLGARFEALVDKHGLLNPEIVLEDARPASSPTHEYFEWDDATAANQWRVNQAHYYLRSIEVVREETESPVRVRAFEVVRPDPEEDRGYTSYKVILGDKAMLAQVIARYERDLQNLHRQMQGWEELASVTDALAEALGRLAETREAQVA